MSRNILVVGASGTLGGMICSELNRYQVQKNHLFVGDYNDERGIKTADRYQGEFRKTDLSNKDSLISAFQNIDTVIVALNQAEPIIQEVCVEMSILCIDVTVFTHFIRKVQTLYQANPSYKGSAIMTSGFFPGLSGIMIKHSISGFKTINTLNLSLIQNTNAKVGISGIVDMLKIISHPIEQIQDDKNRLIPGFNLKHKAIISNKEVYKVRRIHHPEIKFIEDILGIKSVKYWTAWNNPRFNWLISVLKKIGIIDFFTSKKGSKLLGLFVNHDASRSEEVTLIVEVNGITNDNIMKHKKFILKSFSDYNTTAMVVAAIAYLTFEMKIEGVIFPFEIIDLKTLLSTINDSRISLTEIEEVIVL